MTQKQALEIMISGSNVFLTGPPGSGKTFLLAEFIRQCKKRKLSVSTTATTGIAATLLNGVTIHSWSGIGIKNKINSREKLIYYSNTKLTDRYKQTDVLVIDEVSMLDAHRLDIINEMAKYLRGSELPMGGIQTVLVGDLFQLPPIDKYSGYPFMSKTWEELCLKICYLTEQHRQQPGDELNSILQAIRENRVSKTELDILSSKISPKPTQLKNILKMYSHNFDVDQLNDANLNKIKANQKVYKMIIKGMPKAVSNLKRSILSPELLKLKVGCEVIFTANNYTAGYVNGDRGRVVDFRSNWPVVRMKRSAYLTVLQHHWRAEINNLTLAEVWQIPLRLAWAVTIHKSQGMSLDEAEIDLGRAFSPGMGYVALSRLRNIDGLYLTGLNKMSLYVDKEVLNFDEKLRSESNKLMIR